MEYWKIDGFVEIDERLETLCDQFAGLEEPEKDYILEVSQTLAHSIKGAMSEYTNSIKERLA